MNRPGFFEGVVLSVFISITGSILFHGLESLLSVNLILQPVIAVTFFIYLLYLLIRSKQRTGRITVIALWFLASLLMLSLNTPIMIFLLVQGCMLWLIRSVYFYTSVLSSAADLLLTTTGILAAVWTARYTDSLIFSLWSFYLIQALFVTIPVNWRKPALNRKTSLPADDSFEHAYHSAEKAVRLLSSER